MEVPVYLFWGFLESGKTSLIIDTLSQDYFLDGERTMILSFEEGEVEYDSDFLEKSNSFVVQIHEIDQWNEDFWKACQKNYHPDRVMIEYNGMYPIEPLMDVIDETELTLYQTIVTVDATTSELYLNNMRSMMVEMFKFGNLIIFNRCDDETPIATYRRSIKAVHKTAQVGFERRDGKEVETKEMLPYDLTDDIVTIQEEDYGIFYIDAMEHPDTYVGKTIQVKTMVRRPQGAPAGIIVPGRYAMTCCEDDITFIGYLCKLEHAKSKTMKKVTDKDWIVLTAKVGYGYHEAYEGEGIVLEALRIEGTNPAKDRLIYF
ncbi:MAG: GTP-binding protein [Anaerostipes sp.]|nr:GTP-binding protein [Anaerostipes sp.]